MNKNFLMVMSLLIDGGALAYVILDRAYQSQQQAPVSQLLGNQSFGGSIGEPYASCDLELYQKAGSIVVASKRGKIKEVYDACQKAGFQSSVIWRVELIECRWTGELTQEKFDVISDNPNVEFVEPNSFTPQVQPKRTNQPVLGSEEEEEGASFLKKEKNDAKHNSNIDEKGADPSTQLPPDECALRDHYGLSRLRCI